MQLSISLARSHLMVSWSVLFLSTKAAGVSLQTTHFVVLRPHLFIQRAQCVQAFLLMPAPFRKLFAGLGSTIKTVTSLPFSAVRLSLCPSYASLFSVLLSIPHSGTSGRDYPFSPPLFLLGYNGSPVTHSFRAMTRPMSGPTEARRFSNSLSHVVSHLLLQVFTLLFSGTVGVVSHLNCSTHRFLQYPLRNLCFFDTLVVSFLVFSATDTALVKH